MTWDQQIKAAEKRVADMDKLDGYKDRELATIILALRAGLKCNAAKECAFDALIMLADLAGRKDLLKEIRI